jgi:hypothetical protein
MQEAYSWQYPGAKIRLFFSIFGMPSSEISFTYLFKTSRVLDTEFQAF